MGLGGEGGAGASVESLGMEATALNKLLAESACMAWV